METEVTDASGNDLPELSAEEKIKKQAEGIENLRRLVSLTKRKKILKDELTKIEVDLTACGEEAKEFFVKSGIQSMKIDDRTPYLYRQVFAGVAEGHEKKDVKEALETVGLDEYIGYNSQSLNGYIREELEKYPDFWNKQGSLIATDAQIMEALPPELAQVLKVSEKMSIKVRK
jgi:hypothetical protein